MLTGFGAGVVLELVTRGTLALQLSIGYGQGRCTLRTNTGVFVGRLWETQQTAWLVGAGIMP